MGIFWFPDAEDTFQFLGRDELLRLTKFTKRKILSAIGRIFDLLGFLGPITMTAKLIMQGLWSLSNVSHKKSNGQKEEKNAEMNQSQKISKGPG